MTVPELKNAEQSRPLFYLAGKTIYKRPVSRLEGDRTITTLGFPVCTVSEYIDEAEVLKIFNEVAT
jgi:hypothetical protein